MTKGNQTRASASPETASLVIALFLRRLTWRDLIVEGGRGVRTVEVRKNKDILDSDEVAVQIELLKSRLLFALLTNQNCRLTARAYVQGVRIKCSVDRNQVSRCEFG
jgi:hypothetical protein